MKTIVLLCHPIARSFNHAIASRAAGCLRDLGHEVVFHDLYAEGFDPVLTEAEIRQRFSFDETVQRHMNELDGACGIVVVHPDWWGSMPALLKGWVDRVLRPGIGFDFEGEEFSKKELVPLLAGKRAVVFATTDAVESESTAVLESLWRDRIFAYCGIGDAAVRVFRDMRRSTHRERTSALDSVESTLREHFGC